MVLVAQLKQVLECSVSETQSQLLDLFVFRFKPLKLLVHVKEELNLLSVHSLRESDQESPESIAVGCIVE